MANEASTADHLRTIEPETARRFRDLFNACNLPYEARIAFLPRSPRDEVGEDLVVDVVSDAFRVFETFCLAEPRCFETSARSLRSTLERIYRAGYVARFDDEASGIAAASEKRQAADGWVYFIQAGVGGPIKIGTALDVGKRLAGLQISHHAPLLLLAQIGGRTEREKRYHKQFADYRIRGEWFEPAPAILAEIDRISGEN